MTSSILQLHDQVHVPVSVRLSGQPITLADWPSCEDVRYGRVPAAQTTWRELLLASIAVGRSLDLHMLRFADFALAELRVRVYSLISGLQHGRDDAGNPVIVRSSWLIDGSDPTEAAAVGYRLGMAAAHWVCVQQWGLDSTGHVSFLNFNDPRRGNGGAEADLHGVHPSWKPPSWLVEAKGAARNTRVTRPSRVNGARQLDAARCRSWPEPHVQALVSAAANPLVHLLVELGVPDTWWPDSHLFDPSRWPLASADSRAGSTEASRFLQRALIGAALLASETRKVHFGTAEASVIDVPGTDVAVGLLGSAYRSVERQLRRAYDGWDKGIDDAVHDPVAYAITGPEPSEDELAEDYSSREWEALAIGATTGGRTVLSDVSDSDDVGAIDDAGRVVVLGPSWRERQQERPA